MYVCIYLYHKKRQKRSEERTRNENLFFFLPLRPQRPSGRLSSAVGLLLLGAFLFGLHLVFMLSLSLSRFYLFIFFFSSFSSFFATIRRNLVRFTHGDDWNEDAISTRLSPECSRRVFSSFCSAFFSNKFCTWFFLESNWKQLVLSAGIALSYERPSGLISNWSFLGFFTVCRGLVKEKSSYLERRNKKDRNKKTFFFLLLLLFGSRFSAPYRGADPGTPWETV